MKTSDHIHWKLIEGIEDHAILFLDAEGNIVKWNKGAEKIKGYKAEEVIGKNFSIFYAQADREKKLPEQLISKATLQEQAIDEGWIMKKDGTCFLGSIRIIAIYDENNKVVGYSQITRDLTEAKSLKEVETRLEHTEINVPDKLLPRIQVIEYLRAFLLGRMAWSKLDGLLIISGAFGMFDKEIAIKAGGYNHKTVGEDMELVIRMQRFMIESEQKYLVAYIPNPLCWTEAPENFSILRKQRSRWTRGTMETLWIHRKMFLNPKYKILGLLSIPYWFLFEYLAPIIEFVGLLITLFFVILGVLSWKFFVLLLLFVYCFGVMFSILALLTEEYTYFQYRRIKDINKLLFGAIIEPIYFHVFTVYAALKGNWEKIRGNKDWGTMVRTGFDKK